MTEPAIGVTPARQRYEEGYDAFRAGDTERSRRLNEESLAIARATEDPLDIVHALMGFARLALRDHDLAGVGRLTTEARGVAEAAGRRELLRLPLHMDAEAARMAGDLDRARALYEQSIALNTELGNELMVAVERSNLSWVEIHQGHLDAAESLLDQALAYADAHDDAYGRAFGLIGYARVAVDRGDPERGARLLGTADTVLERAGEVLDPADLPEYERVVQLVTDALGQDQYAELHRAGAGSSPAAAAAFAKRTTR